MSTTEALVIVADGDEESRDAIAGLVGRLGLPVASVATGDEALELARLETPALVVLAVDLEEPFGYAVCQELRDRFGDALPIVFVSAAEAEARDEIAGLLLGADDYFAKPLRTDLFLARVRRLVGRSQRIPDSPAPSAATPLTSRETEVMQLLVEGHRPADIAERLSITRKTASTHVEHILGKLEVHSQAHAVAIAVRDGLARVPAALPATGLPVG